MTFRRKLAALGATLALVAGACSGGSGSDGAAPETGSADPTATPATVDEAPTAVPDEQPDDDVDSGDQAGETTVVFAADAQVLTDQFAPIEPGQYRVDGLGTPVSFEIAGDWFVQPNSLGHLVLTHPDSQGPGDLDVVFLRPTSLSDPDDPTQPQEDQTGWPVDDIDGWLENLIDGVVTGGPTNTTLGGQAAVTFDVSFEDTDICGAAFFCVGFLANGDVAGYSFEPGIEHQVYWVDQGAESPIAVIVGSPPGDTEWMAQVDELLASVAFGPTGPHPIPDDAENLWELGIDSEAPPGLIELPLLGGIAFETSDTHFFGLAGQNHMALFLDLPADVEFWTPLFASDGTPIASTDDLVGAFEAIDITVAEAETITTPMGSTRVFDVSGNPNADGSISTSDAGNQGWRSPLAGRAWVFETDRGILVITAEAFQDAGDLEIAQPIAESIVASLTLVDEPDGKAAVSMTDVLGDQPSGDGWAMGPGTYVSDALSSPVAMQLDSEVALADVIPGLIGIGQADLDRPNNELFAIFNASGVPDATGGAAPMPDDIGGYLAGLPQLDISDSGTSTVGTVEAEWWDVSVADGASGTEPCQFGNCFALFTHDTVGAISVGDEWMFRLWSVPDPDGHVLVLAQARPDSFADIATFTGETIAGLRVLPMPAEPAAVDDSNLGDLFGAADGPTVVLDAGQYTSDSLPMPVTIDVPDGFALTLALPSQVAFAPGDWGPSDPFVGVALIEPVRGLADPAEIGGPFGPPEAFVEVPEDLSTWLDEIPQLDVTDSGTGSIGGIDSSWVLVNVVGAPERNGDCEGTPCFNVFDWASGPWVIIEGSPQQLWLVPHPDGTIILAIEAPADGFDDWLAAAQPLIDGISFG